MRLSNSLVFGLILLAGMLNSTTAFSQLTYTWQTTTGNWNLPANWLDQNNNPGPPLSAPDTTLVFGGSSNYTATNDLGPFTLNTLNFSNTGTTTIAGTNTLSFAGVNASLNVANGSGLVTVESPMTYTTATSVTNSSSSTLVLGRRQTFDAGAVVTYNGTGNINLSPTIQQPSLSFANGSGITYLGTGQLNVGPQGVNAAANSLNTITFANDGTYTFTLGTNGNPNSGNMSLGDNASSGANTTILYNPASNVTLNFANYNSNSSTNNTSTTGVLSIGNFGNMSGTVNILAGYVRFGVLNGPAINTGGDLFGSNQILNVANGATFDFNGNGENMGAISGAGTIRGASVTATLAGTYTWAGNFATSNFTVNGGLNYTLSGNNTSTGSLTAAANSSINIGDGGTTGFWSGNIAANGTVRFNRSDDFAIPTVISGGVVGTVIKQGSGTLTLSATNTYSGFTTVESGTLRVVNRTAASPFVVNDGAGIIFRNVNIATPFATSTLALGSGGATTLGFELNGGLPTSSQTVVNVATANGLTLLGNSTVDVSSTGTFFTGQYPLIRYQGSIQGNGFSALTLNTATLPFRVTGNLVNNTSNSTIDLNIIADFIRWNGNVAGQVWDIDTTPNFVLNSNSSAATYIQAGPGQVDSPVFNDLATNYVVNIPGTISPNAISVNNSLNDYLFQGAGSISGSTGLVKEGTAKLIIATDNNFTGAMTIAGGTVQLGNGGTTGSVTSTITGSGTLTQNRADDFTIANTLSGTVNFTKTGTNTVTLTGNNLTTGTFTLTQGVLSVSEQANLGGNSTIAFNGGTLRVTGTINTSGSGSAATQQLDVGTAGGVLEILPGVLLNKRGDQLVGSGTLVVDGGGILGLGSAGTSSLNRLDFNAGAFRLTSQRTNSLGELNMGAGTTLYLLDTSSFTLTTQFRIAIGGTISMAGGDGIQIPGVTGNANILGTNTGSGAWLHILDEAGSSNAGINSPIVLTGQNRFTQLNVRNGGDVADTVTDRFNQPISGTGGITKDGNGSMFINAISTYSGPTIITNGTFGLTGTATIDNTPSITIEANGVYNVAGLSGTYILGSTNAQTLQGLGSIVGTVVVGANGTIRGDVGTGTGTLTTGSVSIQPSGAILANIGATGINSNLAVGSNTLDLSTNSLVRLTAVTGFNNSVASSYTLATLSGNTLLLDGSGTTDGQIFGTFVQGTGASGPVNLDLSQFGSSLVPGDTFNLARVGNNLVISFTPVPEPATVLTFASLGALAWVGKRKRR